MRRSAEDSPSSASLTERPCTIHPRLDLFFPKASMPALTIIVTRQDDRPVSQEIKADFEAAGGTIGRATDSTLVLPDPERQISRTHARIVMRDSDFVLHDE